MTRFALPQSKLKARRHRRRLVLVGIIFLAIIIVAGALVALSWAPFVRIQNVEIVGVTSVATSTVESAVREQLGGTYYYVFTKDNIFFYSKQRIQTALERGFPGFSSVTLGVQNFKTLRVTIVERRPDALWCGISAASSSPCFLLDENGIVYTPAADFSGTVYIKYYGAVSNTQPKAFLTADQFRSLAALAAAVGEVAKSTVTSVSVGGDNTATIQFSDGFVLMISLADQSADIVQRFTLAIGATPFTAHALSDFQYLDLRFGDRLYYKLK